MHQILLHKTNIIFLRFKWILSPDTPNFSSSPLDLSAYNNSKSWQLTPSPNHEVLWWSKIQMKITSIPLWPAGSKWSKPTPAAPSSGGSQIWYKPTPVHLYCILYKSLSLTDLSPLYPMQRYISWFCKIKNGNT